MRTLKTTLIPALVLLAVACENGTANVAGPEVQLSKTAARAMAPIKGNFVWQATAAALGRCPAGEYGGSVTKVGHATLLGRFTALSSDCFNPETARLTQGETVYTAQNGDQLWAQYAGQVSGSGPLLRVDIAVTVIGGTGRFAGSSGSIAVVGEFDPARGVGRASMAGVISLAGSK